MESPLKSTMENLWLWLLVSVCSTWTQKTNWCQLQYRYIYMKIKCGHWITLFSTLHNYFYWIFSKVLFHFSNILNSIFFHHIPAASTALRDESHLSAQRPGDRLAAGQDLYQKRRFTGSWSRPSPPEYSLHGRGLHGRHSALLPCDSSPLQGTTTQQRSLCSYMCFSFGSELMFDWFLFMSWGKPVLLWLCLLFTDPHSQDVLSAV